MSQKKMITIVITAIIFVILTSLIALMVSKIKPVDFKPAAIMIAIDTSASNQSELQNQIKYVRTLCKTLDPEDRIKIIRMSEDAYLIYEGTPQNSSGISASLEEFTKLDENDWGTAYGLGLKKALNYVKPMAKDGYTPSIIVIGDLENEGATEKQINWDTIADEIQIAQNEMPELSMMFLYAHPSKLDLVKEKLGPVLGETKLVIATEKTIDKVNRNFLNAIGR